METIGVKKWRLLPQNKEQAAELARETGLPQMLCDILAARGYTTREEAEAFLAQEPAFASPFDLVDMDKGVERISRAIEDGEKICIYGDYDCDGMTSTVLLYNYLQAVGADAFYYIPDREEEGYGLSCEAVDAVADQGAELIITVDNGISAINEADYARIKGIDMVITDHHQPRETLPRAAAVIDPHRTDCPSRFKQLAGVGVVFKLICALEGDDGYGILEQYADLIAIGTVADIVPLVEENRAIVKAGLQQMEFSDNCGVRALMEVSGFSGSIRAENIGYGIAPRLNSTARIGITDDAIQLLLCDDPEEARERAEALNQLNQQRKQLEKQVADDIAVLLAREPDRLLDPVLVLEGDNWHAGVIGIVASRMVERYGKPCILLTVEGETARGSARSVEGFSMVEAVESASQFLMRFGGHPMAAGMTLKTVQIPAFREAVQQFAREHFPLMPVYTVKIDRLLQPSEATPAEIRNLSLLEPYGCGNETPVFAFRKTVIEGIYPIGEGKHLRLRMKKGNSCFTAVYFGMTVEKFPYRAGDLVDLAVTCDVHLYNGEEQVSVKVRDLRLSDLHQDRLVASRQRYERYRLGGSMTPGELEALCPSREEIGVVYKYLRQKGPVADFDMLYCRLAAGGDQFSPEVEYGKLRLSVEILQELGLAAISEKGISLVPVTGKMDLESSRILQKIRADCEKALQLV